MAPPRSVRRVVAALGLLAVAGCSGPAANDRPEQVSPAPRSAPPKSSAPSGEVPQEPVRERPRPVTIAVAGDVHFEGVLRARLDDPSSALAPVTDALAAADLGIVNLETSIGVGGSPDPDKRFTFRAPPTAFAALTAAGVDIVSMANNHALDYGRAPLPGTFAAIRRARLEVVGLGPDADAAYRPAVSRVGGTAVATLAASLAARDPTADPTGDWAATDTAPGVADAVDPARLLAAVGAADRAADVVVVYLHWGIQGEGCPAPWQRTLAERLVRAGADVIVGSHAHRLQGDGRLGEGYVAYGLGNYAWYTADSAETATTGVLTLTVQPPRDRTRHAEVVRSRWAPARIGADGLPRRLTGTEAAAFDRSLTGLRECAGVAR